MDKVTLVVVWVRSRASLRKRVNQDINTSWNQVPAAVRQRWSLPTQLTRTHLSIMWVRSGATRTTVGPARLRARLAAAMENGATSRYGAAWLHNCSKNKWTSSWKQLIRRFKEMTWIMRITKIPKVRLTSGTTRRLNLRCRGIIIWHQMSRKSRMHANQQKCNTHPRGLSLHSPHKLKISARVWWWSTKLRKWQHQPLKASYQATQIAAAATRYLIYPGTAP